MAKSLANDHLSEKEKHFLEAVKKGDLCEVKLVIGEVNVNCEEEDGMTPLMFSSYKGNVKMVECLLENGATANANNHKDGYTALMFATLSGSTEVVRMLLEAGAKSEVVNKVNRTASQLGAFVGRHDCVTLINNFVQQDSIKYYTKKQGFQEQPKLKEHIVGIVHRYSMIPNLNPVKLLFFIQDNMDLVANHKSVCDVMETECQKSYKAVNELFALKAHLYSCLLRKAATWESGKEGQGGLQGLIKYMLKGRSGDGFLIQIENFYRTSLKSFPFAKSIIFQQLIKTLSKVQVGDEPTALRAITQSLNGIQSAEFTDCCTSCGERDCFNKCSVCKLVRYCNSRCQKLHWVTHKKFCKQLKAEYELIEEENRKQKESKLLREECHNAGDKEEFSQNGEAAEGKSELSEIKFPCSVDENTAESKLLTEECDNACNKKEFAQKEMEVEGKSELSEIKLPCSVEENTTDVKAESSE